jgi:CelD/BcsL family acetyltransferase involved in cellulose biosynthesis
MAWMGRGGRAEMSARDPGAEGIPEGRLEVRSIRPSELTEEERAAWTRLQERQKAFASPFFRPEYALAAETGSHRVRVAVLKIGGVDCGFFPHERGALGLGRPAVPMVTDFQGVVAMPGASWTSTDLLAGAGLACMEFNHLVAFQEPFAVHHRHTAPSPFIDLPHGYEAYRDERRRAGSEQLKKLEGLERKLGREQGALKFILDDRDPSLVTWIRVQKSRQHRERGYSDALAVPRVRAVVDRILEFRTPGFAGIVSSLRAGDRLVAAHLGMHSRTSLHYWFPSYDPDLARYSPGLLLLMALAREVGKLGIRHIDLGRGEAAYKARFMNGASAVADAWVPRPGARAILGRCAFRIRDRIRRSPLRAWLRFLRTRPSEARTTSDA